MASPHMRTVIVVGVDGSPGSREALRWALRYARSTDAEIRAVMAWDLPTTYGYAPSYEDFDWAEAAREALEKTVEQTMDPDSSVKLSTELVRGHAGNALVGQVRTPTCSWWAAAVIAQWPRCCWARSATIVCSTQHVRWSWCAREHTKLSVFLGDHFTRATEAEARQRYLVRQLEALGHKVTLEPAAA